METNLVQRYLEENKNQASNAMLAYLANLSEVAKVAPEVARSIIKEFSDQRKNLKLIASENYSSPATQLAMGNLLTDKYAEGFPGHRFYAGCDNVDDIESFAAAQACKLFGAEHAFVQPHSGSDANLIAFWAVLGSRIEAPMLKEFGDANPMELSHEQWSKIRERLGNQKLLGMHLYAGGHLTHAYRYNISSKMFDAYTYGVNKETFLIDYEELERMALELKPMILLAGYSAYPRKINFARMRQIADQAGSVLMVDMAHFAGLVAGGVFTGEYNPFPYADIVTTTTHKTLRGPRGGMILCKQELAEYVDKACPSTVGGPLPHVMAAKAVAFTEDLKSEFKEYSRKIVENSQAMAEACIKLGMKVTTGGTDNHLMLIDVAPFGLTGRQAESALRECHLTMNRNTIPFDPNGPWYTSGIRLGTPAVTTLGMTKTEMQEIAEIIKLILANTAPETIASGENAGKISKAKYKIEPHASAEAQSRVNKLLQSFPVYPELDLDFLQEYFG